jgi:shikimate dehydrogenase
LQLAASAIADAALRASASTPRILVGLVGKGIQLSRTPAMHEAAGELLGISYAYRLFDTDLMGEVVLADLVDQAEHYGFDGLNITFPYKQEILPLLTDLSPAAKSLGSVNTVVFRDGRRLGHNTDMWGFRQSFLDGLLDAKRGSVLLIGAGGAGSAVAHALLDLGVASLLIHDVRPESAEALVARMHRHFGAARARVTSDMQHDAPTVDGIVNATPVGMAKLPGIPIDPALIRGACWVADIVYFPLETELLAQARRRGCRTLSGEGMAVFQAVRAFELFTGVKPDIERMKMAFAVQGNPAAPLEQD